MAKRKVRRMKSPDADEALLLFLNARSFDLAVRVLGTQPGFESLLLNPIVAIEAFALELYLKCLHRVRRRRITNKHHKIWGHDTKYLYDKLSKADRKKIAAYLLDIVRGHPNYLEFYKQGLSFEAGAVAQRARSTFNDARYWWQRILPSSDEDGFVSNAGVGNLSDAVRKLLLELRPEWEEKQHGLRFTLPGRGTLPT